MVLTSVNALVDHSARCLTPVQVLVYPRKQLDQTIEHKGTGWLSSTHPGRMIIC